MIVYENLGGMTAKKILEGHGDELRTEPWLLLYEPESETEVFLSNMFDISDLTIWRSGEHFSTKYVDAEMIDDKLRDLSEWLFGKFETRPYSEWLARQRQADDEEKTLRELRKFLSTCKHRMLSGECKRKIQMLVQSM